MQRNRRRSQSIIIAIGFACLVALAGCASLQPANTPRKQLAYAIATYTSVERAATAEVGQMSASDRANFETVSAQALSALQAAQSALANNDTASARGDITTLTNLLVELQTILGNTANGQ